MPSIPNDASKGLVSSRDASTLRQGELSEAVACEYRVGSPHLYKQAGRASLNADLGSSVQALVKAQYDTSTDVLIAVAGGTVFESAASTSPSFASTGLTGLDDEVVPHFVGYNERWLMCNGIDSNYIREPSPVPGGAVGNWRVNGMTQPLASLIATVNTVSHTTIRPSTYTAATGNTYAHPERAIDTDSETAAYRYGGAGYATNTCTWTFTSNFAVANTILYIDHASAAGPCTVQIEYSLNGGTSWATQALYTTVFARTVEAIPLTIGLTMANNLKVRATWGYLNTPSVHYVYDIRVSSGENVYVPPADPLIPTSVWYGYTEIYEDSKGVEHESELTSALTQITVAQMATSPVSITFTLPTKTNTLAGKFGVYRSVDDGSGAGGYPFMYRIGTPLTTDTSWTDDFSDDPKSVPTDKPILKFFIVTFPTGASLPYEYAAPPPLSKMAVPFQGVVAYIPAAAGQGHYLYYSVASTISVAGIGQVPKFQYLDFQSPRNDTITSAATTNGGKSLLVFFSNYTMLVNYLPQASDGVFDNRIKEYVSNNRGSAGRLTTCEFTLNTGQTLVASVDALGLWVTNGVNQMDEWSRDLKWHTDEGDGDMDGIDLTTAILIDNTAKRRLELLYTDAGGRQAERHFFYGRIKEDGDGKPSPLHTGPHPSGCRIKHYTQIDSAWLGFGGDDSTVGDVFLEGAKAADDANGYDANGTVPFSFALADQYVDGISKAQIAESLTSRWGVSPSKTIILEVRSTRDSGHTFTRTKTFTATPGANCYLQIYGDRLRCRYRDLTATPAPEFIGQEITVRDGGPSRDA